MSDTLDRELLPAPFNCPFCELSFSVFGESNFLRLLLHCNHLHAARYSHLRRGASSASPLPTPDSASSPSTSVFERLADRPPDIRSRLGSALFVDTGYVDDFAHSDAGGLACLSRGAAALRCAHNRVHCAAFPDCGGRGCSLAHPPCPDGVDPAACLARNDCVFEHPEYEKTCRICLARRSPPPPLPTPRHCPHRKSHDCTNERRKPGACPRGAACGWSHGLCPKGNTCAEFEKSGCYYEHQMVIYFCPYCQAIAKKSAE